MSYSMPMSYTNIMESMFKLNNTETFEEPINIQKAKILLKLDYEQFKSLIWVDDNNNDNGEFWNQESYIHNCKKFLLKVVNADGINKNSYKYSTKMTDCGRMYVKSFGIQSLQKQLRGYLTSDKLIDFDMINCHPNILNYICNRWYKNYSWVELINYVHNRDFYLDNHNLTKVDILKMMNSNKISTKLKLEQEFKLIQSLLYDKTPDCLQFMNKFKTEKQNPKGKFLNKILCIFENMILHTALSTIPTDKVKVKMFDGFMASNDINVSETITNLNNSTSEYGIKWSVKEPDLSIKINEDEIDEELLNYENVKIKFEKNHFMIQYPLMFGTEYELEGVKKYNLTNISDFGILTKEYMFEDIENGKLIKKSILNRWIGDKTRRSYKTLDFIPDINYKNTEVYNTFTGFDFDTKNINYTPNDNVVNDFINHIGLLTDYDQQSINYINKYIAHIIQKTTEKPEVCLLFKSLQGFGKDLLVNFIEKMLGVNYIFRTAETNDVFGSFNGVIKDKILLQLNELEGKAGFANKEKLKNLITESHTKINEKNVKAYNQTNYLRIIICSNNLTPIEIPFDDRRFCVFQSTQPQPNYLYFEKLFDYLKNNNAMYTLFDYYNNLDISNFSLKSNRPKTTAYKDMKQDNLLYKYINEMFRDEEYKNEFEGEFKVHKATKNIIVKPNHIMTGFKHWLSSNNINNFKIDFKLMKSLMSNIGINQKLIKAGGSSPTNYYVFDLSILRPKMIDMGLDEEIEEYNEDDWE